jgi:hypothetical protein
VKVMSTTISLSQLAERNGRSRETIRTMIANGQLSGAQSTEGRKEWQIDVPSALAAGLIVEADAPTDTSLDSTVRRLLQSELDPLVDVITELVATANRRIDASVWLEDVITRLDETNELLRALGIAATKVPVKPQQSRWTRLTRFFKRRARQSSGAGQRRHRGSRVH